MAGIQRFVTYIYAYENGRKTDNTGYAKLEIRGERGQIEIHFFNGGMYDGSGKVAFLYVENGKLVSIPIGEFSIENGKGNTHFSFRTNKLADTAAEFGKIDGISIIDSEKRRYLSFWKDVDVTDFHETNFLEYRQKTKSSENIDRQKQTDVTEDNRKQKRETGQHRNQVAGAQENIGETIVSEETMEDAEQESLHTMEIPMRNFFPSYTLEGIWQSMAKTKSPVQINNEAVAIQLELSGLKELPKQYWYLGNNSFLLHGFFNYHHILFGKMTDGAWFLGVPGVYDRQERVMASIFGFPEFLKLGSQAQENLPERQQVIWYHILEE